MHMRSLLFQGGVACVPRTTVVVICLMDLPRRITREAGGGSARGVDTNIASHTTESTATRQHNAGALEVGEAPAVAFSGSGAWIRCYSSAEDPEGNWSVGGHPDADEDRERCVPDGSILHQRLVAEGGNGPNLSTEPGDNEFVIYQDMDSRHLSRDTASSRSCACSVRLRLRGYYSGIQDGVRDGDTNGSDATTVGGNIARRTSSRHRQAVHQLSVHDGRRNWRAAFSKGRMQERDSAQHGVGDSDEGAYSDGYARDGGERVRLVAFCEVEQSL